MAAAQRKIRKQNGMTTTNFSDSQTRTEKCTRVEFVKTVKEGTRAYSPVSIICVPLKLRSVSIIPLSTSATKACKVSF